MGKEVSIALVGCGLVGQALLNQLAQAQKRIPQLSLILIANSKKYLVSPNQSSVDLSSWSESFSTSSKNYSSFDEISDYLVSASKDSQNRVALVDCTASDIVPQYYPQLLKAGIYVATPNKKGFSGKLQLFKDIVSPTSAGSAFHEATVGAGLPIISTLKDLVDTGDKVTKIEGIFSGTLSYIFNVFGGSDVKFSQVVKEAKEKGYTEPDPRDDLNGMDVARKLTILARIVGIDVEGPPSSSIFPIDSLIPAALETVNSGDEFVAGLPAHDAEFDEKRAAAKKDGNVLRYVGSIDVPTKTIKVGLQTYPSTHPFAALQGSDNIIAFHTERYAARPLIVQGAGAGAEVTAMGVFADILKIQREA